MNTGEEKALLLHRNEEMKREMERLLTSQPVGTRTSAGPLL